MNIGKFSVSNSVLINISMATLLVLGVFSLSRLPREQFREVPFYWAFASVPYPGAAAEDIERTVTTKIENEFGGLDKVKEITSVTREGLAIVRVQFDDGISRQEFARLYQEFQARFNTVALPDGTLKPILDDFSSSDFLPVVEVVLSGDVAFEDLNTSAKLLRDRLLGVAEVSDVEMVGAKDRQVRIDAQRARMEALGVSLNEIVRAVQARSITVPGGSLQTPSREYLLRTVGEITDMRDFSDIIIRQSQPGQPGVVRLTDVARIEGVLDPGAASRRFNGKPAVALKVAKVTNGNSFTVVDGVRKQVEAFRPSLPQGAQVTYFNDTTLLIRDSLDVLVKNALFGFVLLVLILYLFLGVRSALITALGIPVTFALTFIIMEIMGETLNSNSLFALVLVLGLIVDHAIVIIENSYRLREQGLSRADAAIAGTNEVVVPVIAATLTTVAAFLPLMILPGILGKFLRVIPLVVTIALIASTGEAIVFLPVHFAEWGGRLHHPRHRVMDRVEAWFERFLSLFLRHRYLVIGVSFAAVLGSFWLVTQVRQGLFQGEEYSYFYIDIEMPAGTPRAKTDAVVAQFEARILSRAGTGEIVSVSSSIGTSAQGNQVLAQSNVAQLVVDVAERSGGRGRPLDTVVRDVQELCAPIPGPESVAYRMVRGGPPVDPPVSFRLFGDNYRELIDIADELKKRLGEYPELYNIEDNLERGTPELRVSVNKDRAAELGLSVASVGSYVRAAFDGITATSVFDANEEIKVIVTYDDGSIGSVEQLMQMKLPAADGRQIPFSSVCTVVPGEGLAAIKRVDGKREVTVSAEAYDKKNVRAINAAFSRLFDETLAPLHPGVTFKVGGEFDEFNNILIQILRLFLVGVFLIYLVLGTQFKSYSQPFLILFTIPYAFAGVILYLFVSQTPFSTTVLYAGVALAGIAVNDSIVLISFINGQRREGMGVTEALRAGVKTRLRPILLTSVTTIGGLLPTSLGLGGRSPVWGPMASTIIFGLVFSTLTALLMIPCLYGILDDVNQRIGRITKSHSWAPHFRLPLRRETRAGNQHGSH